MNTRFLSSSLTLAVAVTLTACGDGMHGMGGMADMPGMGAGGMIQMHSHMAMMEKMSPDSMQVMLPAHRQMAANMLSQMSAEMRKMNMPTDAAFKAVGDSLRQDLVRMPEMGARELASAFPAHHERMMGYMKMHEQMMKNMKM